MPEPIPTAVRARSAKSVLFIALFLLLIWLPTLDTLIGLDHTVQTNENRALAPFPELEASRRGVHEFIAGLESYYSDHFGFRRELIHLHNRWKHKWFDESPTSKVIQGKDGWYFFASDQLITEASAPTHFDEATLHTWCDLLEARRAWLAQRGIAYLFVIPPDKHTVYPEYLPDWVRRGGDTTLLAQLLAYMKTHSTVPILDLRPVLSEAKKTTRVFQFTDTHWTPDGAFVTYQALVRELSKQLPGLNPIDAVQVRRELISKPGGDLARLLGQDDLVEKNFFTLVPIQPLAYPRYATNPRILAKAWPPKTEPAATENPNATGKAIVFRDSFASSWNPYLGLHFNRVIYIWQYEWDTAFIEREKPDVVIDEIMERFLNEWNPAGQRDALK